MEEEEEEEKKYDFNVGDKVFAKFRGKWELGRIEFTKKFGLAERIYVVSFKGAKTYRERKIWELRHIVRV